ncbi:AAA family ATPase [Paenibacillus sp. Y5S-9]|uniref:ATP-dependent nuclease n=1 Tax=Paenibacillus sp. Y5S-9 TaxID=3122489 RepID=UPI0030D00593
MKIRNVHIKNYKSIKDSGIVQLHNKINVLAGKNNTGKTAFIEVIYKVLTAGLSTSFSINANLMVLVLEVDISKDELNILYNNVEANNKIENVERVRLSFEYNSQVNISHLKKVERYNEGNYKIFYNLEKVPHEEPKYTIINMFGETFFYGIPIFINNLFSFLKSKIVYISGSRYVPQVEKSILQDSLYIDGTNLNAFLYTLHNNQEKTYDNIIKTFTQIFTDVASISTPINGDNNTYVSLYFEGNETPIPLSNCGSGFTHVLLLLCVLFTKKNSLVLFDEPQVFLHPSAEKAIYDLVNDDNGNHQYTFTTHSPILINYPVEKHLFHVSKPSGHSNFVHLEKIQEMLLDIGIYNSDYALSDKVIFVEGETEERVIPLILSHFDLRQIGYNYRILNMKGTGKNFIKKTAMREYKEKLDLVLGGVSQSPIPYKIIIDPDNKTEEKITELKESYGENIIILERREYENYFLDCYEELSEIINQDLSGTTNSEQIMGEVELLLSKTDDIKLFPRGSTTVSKDVVGSEVLERLFASHSLTYNKIVHGIQLTNLVLENTPDKLEFFKNELQDFIKG